MQREKSEETIQLNQKFWDNLWQNQQTQWDIGFVAPPIQHYIDTITQKDKSILIPGCGNAYEAIYLLQNGFTNITLIDIAPKLIHQLEILFSAYIGKEITLLCEDFFKHIGQYDIIIEQTFFCAIAPSMRNQYCLKMKELLKQNGTLVGLLFNKDFETNPPFGGNKEEYIQLFSTYFIIEKMEECITSIAPRIGTELWFEVSNNKNSVI